MEFHIITIDKRSFRSLYFKRSPCSWHQTSNITASLDSHCKKLSKLGGGISFGFICEWQPFLQYFTTVFLVLTQFWCERTTWQWNKASHIIFYYLIEWTCPHFPLFLFLVPPLLSIQQLICVVAHFSLFLLLLLLPLMFFVYIHRYSSLRINSTKWTA